MTTRDIKREIIKVFDPFLGAMNFESFEDGIDKIYIQKTSYGYNKLDFSMSNRRCIGFSLDFYIRINDINTICNSYNPNYVDTAYDTNPTLSAWLKDFGFSQFQFFPETKDELTKSLLYLKDMIIEYIIPFFEKYDSVNAIDLELNRINRPANLYINDTFSRPFVAITAAALNKNTEFNYWENYYRKVLKNDIPKARQGYEDLVSLLKEKYVGK